MKIVNTNHHLIGITYPSGLFCHLSAGDVG